MTEYENDYQSLGQGYAYLLSDWQTASMPVLLAGYSDCRAKHHVRPHCTIHLLLQLRKMDACGWISEKLKPESWVIMPLYTCPRCHYTFPSVEKPGACPDCGHKRIVPATDFEFNRFYAEKLDLIRTVKADDMSVDERNWSRILLLLNVPKASFYTSFFIKQHILEGDAEHALDMYKGYRWEFKRRVKDERIALQLEGHQEPKFLLRDDTGAPVVRGWEYYGPALKTLYSFELKDEHKAPNLRTVDKIDLDMIAQMPSTAYFDFLRAWLDLVKDVPAPGDDLIPEMKPLLKLLPPINGNGKGDGK